MNDQKFVDRTIACAGWNGPCDGPGSFVFTANDQAFFKEKGFPDPKRCKACKAKKTANPTPIKIEIAPPKSGMGGGGGKVHWPWNSNQAKKNRERGERFRPDKKGRREKERSWDRSS